LTLLGRVTEADRPAVLNALRKQDAKALNQRMMRLRADRDRDLSIGSCIAAKEMAADNWLVHVRRLFFDRDPGVRLAATEAMAVIGKTSAVMGLRDLLGDSVPEIRMAALESLYVLISTEELMRYRYMLKDETNPEILSRFAEIEASPRPTPGS